MYELALLRSLLRYYALFWVRIHHLPPFPDKAHPKSKTSIFLPPAMTTLVLFSLVWCCVHVCAPHWTVYLEGRDYVFLSIFLTESLPALAGLKSLESHQNG